MRETLSLFSLAWKNRRYRRELGKVEREKLGSFTWYRSLIRALNKTYRWKNPFLLARSARAKISLPKSDLIFGETPPITAYDLLQELKIDHAHHVVECGGGRGIFSLVAVSSVGCRATVLEIVPAFVNKTREVISILGLERLQVKLSNILESPLPEGDLYFLTSTTFCEDSWRKLERQMAAAPVGARAVSLSVALDNKAWKTEQELSLPFSWGENTVFIQRRI